MSAKEISIAVTAAFGLLTISLLGPNRGFAHCDGLDGPVVQAAQQALETKNVNLVLIWVAKADEPEISEAFQKTVAVRSLNRQARELADMYFFETLVRIHRAGEGESYTGLKPAWRDLGPAIPTADEALESRKLEPLLKLLTQEMQSGIRQKFEDVLAKKDYQADNVQAGREYVEAYVRFLEHVERIHESTKNPGHGHSEKSGKAALHKEEER
ncbi:MAG TPA: DUF6448 family protein [Pyrinomonadaceae bacterium]|nr:DUF6448 family protein [Pyrinomonadaceae bacterium]